MLLFRSEDHLDRWLQDPSHPKGGTLSLAQQWQLAQQWFSGRHLPDWRKRTGEEAEAVFRSVGLTSDFWRLT